MRINDFNNLTGRIRNSLRSGVGGFASYFNILYFIEIINLMFLLSFVTGKAVAMTAGLILALLLSVQIIMMYFKRQRARRIQLFMMDIHAAIAIGGLLRAMTSPGHAGALFVAFIAFRIVIVTGEALLIYLLTDEEIIASFE